MTALFIIASMLLIFAAALALSRRQARRATEEVIDRFCRCHALDVRSAKTQEALGLSPPGLIARLTKMRDYKPYAVQMLKRMKIVQTTRDGKLYLVQDKLYASFRCRDREGNPAADAKR